MNCNAEPLGSDHHRGFLVLDIFFIFTSKRKKCEHFKQICIVNPFWLPTGQVEKWCLLAHKFLPL